MKYQVKKDLGAIVRHDGVQFRVWAPFAKNVMLAENFYDESGTVLQNEGDGYWSLFVPDIGPGYTYQYLIETDNGIVHRNDPRARVLTASENGMSVVAANDFDWGDDVYMPLPREQQVLYELHIGTFNRPDASTGGTFADAMEKLDYLETLGVTMIELMPVTSMAVSHGWGYATDHLFAVEAAYGGRHGLMQFVRAAHDRGIGVMLDLVYNHFVENCSLWMFDGWGNPSYGGIYFYDDERSRTPWGGRPDYGRPEVRQFILDNVAMWLSEYRLDGLRLDSTIYMRNTEGANNDPTHDIADAWGLLSKITSLAHKINPGSLIVAEDCSVNDYITKPARDGGAGFNAQWGLNFPHGLRALSGLSVPFPVNFYDELQSTYNDDPFQKVIFSDSHDTAANGQVRLNEAVTPGNAESERARQYTLLASAMTLTAPGIPMLMQGQEFMQDGDFSEWKELEWAKTEQFAGIVTAHEHLVALRRNAYGNTAGLMGPNIHIFHKDETNTVLGYHRWLNGGACDDVLVIANFGKGKFPEYQLTLPVAGTWRVRFNSSWSGYGTDAEEMVVDTVHSDAQGLVTLSLAPLSVLVLSQD